MSALAEVRRRFRLPERQRADGPTRPPTGWLVVANKEFGDHVTSIRFVVLLLILAVAVAPPLYFASGTIRDAAPAASGQPAVFLALFTLSSQDIPILRFDVFVGLLAPLLGIAFGFDAVNVERTERTLPRLVAQPIHRDDVINGKFAAGLGTIALMIAALTLLVAGFGIFRLGITPSASEVIRLFVWYVITIVYVGFWLAFAMLLSVALRRAAASALIAFGVWFFFMVFWSLVATLVAAFVASPAGTAEQQLANLQVEQTLSRLSPATLYQEAALVILNPVAGSQNVSVPSSLGAYIQAQQQIASLHSLDQSLLLVWPQVVGLVALTVIAFALSYVLFMRQEVRA
jgi:ABC-2 type transport system permease protein